MKRKSTSSISFEKKQSSVGWRGLLTISFILLIFYVIPRSLPLPFSDDLNQSTSLSTLSLKERIEYFIPWILLPIFMLLVAILRMIVLRLHSPSDIDAALTEPTKIAIMYQSIIQNTLEQTVIAIPIYIVAIVLFPISRLMSIPAASLLFFLGRIAFMIGYPYGAPGRSIGFALTLIPSILLFVEISYYILLGKTSVS